MSVKRPCSRRAGRRAPVHHPAPRGSQRTNASNSARARARNPPRGRPLARGGKANEARCNRQAQGRWGTRPWPLPPTPCRARRLRSVSRARTPALDRCSEPIGAALPPAGRHRGRKRGGTRTRDAAAACRNMRGSSTGDAARAPRGAARRLAARHGGHHGEVLLHHQEGCAGAPRAARAGRLGRARRRRAPVSRTAPRALPPPGPRRAMRSRARARVVMRQTSPRPACDPPRRRAAPQRRAETPPEAHPNAQSRPLPP